MVVQRRDLLSPPSSKSLMLQVAVKVTSLLAYQLIKLNVTLERMELYVVLFAASNLLMKSKH